MSGGSMDYLYRKLDECYFARSTAMREAFAEHIKKVAKALHDIEWVDSADYGPGDEDEAIMACINPADAVDAARQTLAQVERAATLLRAFLERSERGARRG